MLFELATLIFFLIASAGLVAMDLLRDSLDKPSVSERYGWLAILAGVAHPLAAWVNTAQGIHGDITPFLAFDLIAACGVAAACANRSPGGKAFIPLTLLAASALSIGVQLVGVKGSSISGSLMASALMFCVLIGAAAECARHARQSAESMSALSTLAILCITSAMLWLVVVLLLATTPVAVAHLRLLLEAAGTTWLLLKLMITSTLLHLFMSRRAEGSDRLARLLVDKANAASADMRVILQAFYQLPEKILVTNPAGSILFASAEARRTLAFPETADKVVEDLFIAVQPTGHQRVRALFQRPDHQAELMQIAMTSIECRGLPYHLLQLQPMPFDFVSLRNLLVDSRSDAPHEASGLLDQNFAIAAMADGWFRLLDPLDRYAAAGLLWDKLRILSAQESEITYLESTIATHNQASGWMRMRDGAGLEVTLQKLHTPDHKVFYRLNMTLVDDALKSSASAPYPGPAGEKS